MVLSWTKCQDDVWCAFWNLDLNSVSARVGVYVIWCDLIAPPTLYVGSGEITKAIERHRREERFTRWRELIGGQMHVTWAELPGKQALGAEAHLIDVLHPQLGEKHPENVVRIQVIPPHPRLLQPFRT